ncbi:MAG TPA: DUF3017 domain-containing protein [Streptosporangiaceae bacterium]
MTGEVTGITPPAGPGGRTAYGLAGMAGTVRGGWPPPEPGPGPSRAARAASPRLPHPGSPHPGSQYPESQYPESQYPGSPHPGSQYPGPPHPGSQYPGSQYPGSPHPGSQYPGPPPAYPEPPVHHQHQPAPDGPPVPPRGARSRRSGGGRGTQIPYVIVVAGLAAGLAYIWQGPHSVRAGTFILAGALFVAVAARLALPERRAGMLASRRRYIDVTALAILAIGLLVAGLVLPTPS